MKAIRYHGPKKAFRLEDISRPEPQAGEVLVKITALAMCHTVSVSWKLEQAKKVIEDSEKSLLKTTAIGGRKWKN